jgi:hypothetical protein
LISFCDAPHNPQRGLSLETVEAAFFVDRFLLDVPALGELFSFP